jgi:hypothetical protein
MAASEVSTPVDRIDYWQGWIFVNTDSMGIEIEQFPAWLSD